MHFADVDQIRWGAEQLRYSPGREKCLRLSMVCLINERRWAKLI